MSGALPLVSVVCLCYNHEDTVAGAIESIVTQQTDFPFELIIHDDASTDGTADIIRAYREKYPEIIVPVLQSENRYHTCNIAETYIMPLVRGKYIAVCEGDDYWTDPQKLAVQTALMQKDDEIAMSFHAVTQLSPDGGKMIYRPLKQSGPADPDTVIKRGGMFCPSVSLMVRQDIAALWPRFRQAADVYDYPLQALCAEKGKIWYIDRDMGVYRYAHKNSWTAGISVANDFAHIENELHWLGLFDEYSGGRFRYAIDYHTAHLWLTEYRKSFSPELRCRAFRSAGKLKAKDRIVFTFLILMFSLLKKRSEPVWQFIKKLLLK